MMGGKSEKGVSFSGSVSVVLIPERNEFKKAKCDLWWNREDYFSFHQSAFSELKLFSLCENICPREARRKLYQPTPEEGCATAFYSKSDDDLDIQGSEPCDDITSDEETLIDEASRCYSVSNVASPPISPMVCRPMQKVSSIYKISERDQHHESHIQTVTAPIIEKLTSLEEAGSNAEEGPGFNSLLPYRSSVPRDLSEAAKESSPSPPPSPSIADNSEVQQQAPAPSLSLKTPIPSQAVGRTGGAGTGRMSAEAEAEYYLSFCVRMQHAEQLCIRDKGSRCSHSRSKRRGLGGTGQHGSDPEAPTGLTFFLGLCSFTLPIVGYYVMHYCQ